MRPDDRPVPGRRAVWAGRILSALCVAFLLLDGMMKVVKAPPAMEASTELGIPASAIEGIGVALVASTVLYAIPQTAVLGAILLAAYLGGAIATHVIGGGPAFPMGFAAGLGVLVWLGLYLRDARLRELVPLRQVQRQRQSLAAAAEGTVPGGAM